jgi:phosphatidylglycerophosphate synthase
MKFRDLAQSIIYRIIHPIVISLIKLKVTPNTITTIGLLLNIVAAAIFIVGALYGARGDLSHIGWGCAMFLFAGLFDMLDGQVARYGNMASKYGALYDSVLDRYSELVMFLGICYFLVANHYFISSMLTFIALIGSMMVSYVRARAQGLGIECKEGFMQRPERIIIISVSGIICGIVSSATGGNQQLFPNIEVLHGIETISIFVFPIFLVAVFANITAFNRLQYCKKQLSNP